MVEYLGLVPAVLAHHELDHFSGVQKQQGYDMDEWLDTRVRIAERPVLEEILSGQR